MKIATRVCLVLCALALPVFSSGAAAQDVEPQLTRAIESFFSANQAQAMTRFSGVIDTLDARPAGWSDTERNAIVTALAYRSQLFLNATNERSASDDLTRLVQLQPDYRFDESQVSPKIVDLLGRVRGGLNAALSVKAPPDSILILDSRRVDRPNLSIPVATGFHVIEVRTPAGTTTLSSEVAAGQTARLDAGRQPAATRAQNPGPTPTDTGGFSSRGHSGGEAWRRVFIDASAAIFGGGKAQSQGFTQTIYSQTANLEVDTKPLVYFGRSDLGGAVRIARAFGIGVHRTETHRKMSGTVSGSVPSPQFVGFSRPFDGVPAAFDQLEQAWHVDARAQLGGEAAEVALFIGPSFVQTSGTQFGFVTVRELAGNGFVVTPVPVTHTEHKIGLNLGFDVSWFPDRFVGIGGGLREVIDWNQDLPAAVRVTDYSTLLTAGLRVRF